MAKFEQSLYGNFDELLSRIERGVMGGSISASLEDTSDFYGDRSRCSVRVFERYSAIGSNRVSLSVTLYQDESGCIRISAITSGGSQAVLFKVNTFGEEAFLDKLRQLL